MQFRITRGTFFSEFTYKISGGSGNSQWTALASGILTRSLLVKRLKSNDEYKLRQENALLRLIEKLPIAGAFLKANYFYYDNGGNKTKATKLFGSIQANEQHMSSAAFALSKGISVRPSNLLSSNLLSSQVARQLYIEGDVYILKKHSKFVFSVIKNNKYIAVCKEDGLITAGTICYEMYYSKAMEGKEHILMLLLLYFDNTFRRHFGMNTLYMSRKEFSLFNTPSSTWKQEEVVV